MFKYVQRHSSGKEFPQDSGHCRSGIRSGDDRSEERRVGKEC